MNTMSDTSLDLTDPLSDCEGAAGLIPLRAHAQPQVNSETISGIRVAEAQPTSEQVPRTVKNDKPVRSRS